MDLAFTPEEQQFREDIRAWVLANLPADISHKVHHALRLRREAGDNLWVFGYSNDVMAYIPSERVLKEGRYEGDTSMVPYGQPGPWSPGLEDRIISKTRELLTLTAPPR